MRRSIMVFVTLGLLGLLLGATAARAENREVRFYGLGPRVGFSLDPDQFVFGGHADFGDPFPHTTLLLPVIEVGVGDHQTVTSIGTDLLFKFTNRWGAWNPYLGGELAFIVDNYDAPGSNTKTDLGLMGIFGVEKGIGRENRFAVEMKFELVDAPNLKFMAVWTFGH